MDPFVAIPAFMALIGIVIVGAILITIVKGIAEWSDNNGQPVLTSPARVIAKRTEVRGSGMHHLHDSHLHSGTSVSTTYYVTFELDTGERREIRVSGPEFGLLVEGDEGAFTYQGTRYKGFDRQRLPL